MANGNTKNLGELGQLVTVNSGTVTYTGPVVFSTLSSTGNVSPGANLAMTGATARITGDFSNATLANRTLFQSSTVNGASYIGAIPNGTSVTSGVQAITGTTANESYGQIAVVGATEVRIDSSYTGSGTSLPLVVYTANTERFRVSTTGRTSFSGQLVAKNGTLTDNTTITWDGDTNGQIVGVTIAGNRTMGAPTNIVQYAVYTIRIAQDATGSRTMTWNAAYKFGTIGAPTLTTTASKVDFVTFIGGAGNTLECLGTRMNAV